MDYDSSTKFISSLAKFLQSLCNGYVEFDNGVQVIGHLYLSVDTGKTIDYILNEKVCKTDENSVTFISNSFHAQPAERPKAPAKKPIEKDSKVEDVSENQTVTPEPRSTNFGTLPSRGAQNSPHSQNFKRAFSPSSKRTKDGASPSKSGRISPKHKKNRTESLDQNLSLQASNPTNENSTSSQPSPTADGITAPVSALSTEALHSASQFTDSYQQNFFQTGDDENSMVDESEERDVKPSIDTDVTFIKEEFAPSSCSQSSNQNRDRNHAEDSSAYYSNQSFPTTNFASPSGFGGTVRSNFSSATERSSLYSSGPGSSHLEADNSGDPSVQGDAFWKPKRRTKGNVCARRASFLVNDALSCSSLLVAFDLECKKCNFVSNDALTMSVHKKTCNGKKHLTCSYCSKVLSRYDSLAEHMRGIHGIGNKVQCRFCGKKFKYRPQMYQHQTICMERPIKLEIDIPFPSNTIEPCTEHIESKITFPYDVTMSVDMDNIDDVFDSKPC